MSARVDSGNGLRVLTNGLVLCGAYWVAAWVAYVIEIARTTSGFGAVGTGFLGELWMSVVMAAPRGVAGAVGTALLWAAIGPTSARQWMWGLAASFGLTAVSGARFLLVAGTGIDVVSRVIMVATHALLPTLGCLVAVWTLARVTSPEARTEPAFPAMTVVGGPPRAVLVAGGTLLVLAGTMVGMYLATAVQMEQMSGWTVAVLEGQRRATFALAQYREAEFEDARIALEQFAAYLERLTPASAEWVEGEAPLSDASGLAYDLMLTYGRLAVRSERARRPEEESSAYWIRAEVHARDVGWPSPARDRIRSWLDRLDAEPSAGPTPTLPR